MAKTRNIQKFWLRNLAERAIEKESKDVY